MSKVYDVFGRVSFPYQQLADCFQQLGRVEGSQILVYEHPSDEDVATTHCHFVYIGGKISVDTVKNRIKATLATTVDKTMWSFKKYDDTMLNQCIQYMSKGKYEPSLNIGFNTELIDKCKSEGFDKKEVKKAKEEVKNDWYYVKLAAEYAVKKYYPQKTIPSMWGEEESMYFSFTEEQCFWAVREVMRRQGKLLGKRKFMDYMFGLQVGINAMWDNSIIKANVLAEFTREGRY